MTPTSDSAALKMRRPCRRCAAESCRTALLVFLRAAGDEGIDHTSQGAAEDRGNPEKPELGEGPSIRKDDGPGAARGVEGVIRDRDADRVDQRHGQADGNGREALIRR